MIACANASCLVFILSQVSRRIHESAIFLWEVTSYCLGARKHSRFPGPIFLRKNHGAFSKWLTDLSYWWILLAAALILLGLYFVFNAFERTRKVKLQLLVLSAMDLVTLLFFLLTFNLRISLLQNQELLQEQCLVFGLYSCSSSPSSILSSLQSSRRGRKERIADGIPTIRAHLLMWMGPFKLPLQSGIIILV